MITISFLAVSWIVVAIATLLYVYFGYIKKTTDKRMNTILCTVAYLSTLGVVILVNHMSAFTPIFWIILSVSTIIYFIVLFTKSKDEEGFGSLMSFIFKFVVSTVLYWVVIILSIVFFL